MFSEKDTKILQKLEKISPNFDGNVKRNCGLINLLTLSGTKGQLISKCFICVITFFEKTKENKSKNCKNEFVELFVFWKICRLEKIISNLSDL